jgi:hypothetical protein
MNIHRQHRPEPDEYDSIPVHTYPLGHLQLYIIKLMKSNDYKTYLSDHSKHECVADGIICGALKTGCVGRMSKWG